MSIPNGIANVVYEVANDGTNSQRYVCNKDAKARYAQHLEVGDETVRMEIRQYYFKRYIVK